MTTPTTPTPPAAAPTTLFLSRHGETVWHAENRYAGISDIDLTPLGAEQAESLGRWAAGASLDAIVTSPLSRARRTAAPAARTTGLRAVVEAALTELDFGIAEGRTLTELEASHPHEVEAFRRDPAANPLPGGEAPEAAAVRGATALLRLPTTHPGGRILVVAHNTLFRLVLCHLLSIPKTNYRRTLPGLRNCAVTELRVTADQTSLISYNLPT
ncbi:histidine phosphatase family protein [Streptomyces sp. NPDC087420]|uniref:histidine phosphatase family protein n=1 Tax=Streptomyces sp. NPDC087420 TaxID=3365785 RepID=UPI0038331517